MKKLIALNDRAYVCEGETEEDHILENTGFVVSQRGVVVIDTTRSLKEAAWIYRQIRTVTEQKVRYVINTHFHYDHVFGNQVFPAPVIAPTLCLAQMRSLLATEWSSQALRRRVRESPDPEAIEGLRIVLPEITFHPRLALNLEGLELELIHMGGHSADSCIVYLPQDKILYASDLVFVDRYPGLKDSNFRDWIAALDRVKEMEARVIVPGHGELCGIEEVQHLQDYLLDLEKRVAGLMRQGLGREEIVSYPSIPRYWNNDYHRLHPGNVGVVHDQLLAEGRG